MKIENEEGSLTAQVDTRYLLGALYLVSRLNNLQTKYRCKITSYKTEFLITTTLLFYERFGLRELYEEFPEAQNEFLTPETLVFGIPI